MSNRLNDEGQHVAVQRSMKVKDKRPAAQQITAEQILREAQMHQEPVFRPPRRKIMDKDELEMYQAGKRKGFEDNIRRVRTHIGQWLNYARWEESQKEFRRARSVYERALDVDSRSAVLWLAYVEFEMKHKNVNHARNIWDRAVTLLPRVDQFWFKYTLMEEQLGNVSGAREVFERWMKMEPEPDAWAAYIKMELRYNEENRARDIYKRYVVVHNVVKPWMRYARFEEKAGQVENSRRVYEQAIAALGAMDELDENIFIAFAGFEQRQHEYDRARVIYKYALENIPKNQAGDLYRLFMSFEKQYGDREAIEDAIIGKRRMQYEEEVKKTPFNYDSWFDFIRLEEANGDADKIRDVYERAIANVPPKAEKRLWRRYIYLWIMYAMYEEVVAVDLARTRQVYFTCLDVIPHKVFTFAKIWIMFAHFELRQKNLEDARRIFGNAIGKCPKDKLFRGYIELETNLGEIDRCRKIYAKYVEYAPHSVKAWSKFAEMEASLGEIERARTLYSIAIEQDLDMPEVLWKNYIDFEIASGESDKARTLYEDLLGRTQHVKVWVSYAAFESPDIDHDDVDVIADKTNASRKIFERAWTALKEQGEKEQRVSLYESWKEFEDKFGTPQTRSDVAVKEPTRVTRRLDGQDYTDYIFKDDDAPEKHQGLQMLLAKAKEWKKAENVSVDL